MSEAWLTRFHGKGGEVPHLSLEVCGSEDLSPISILPLQCCFTSQLCASPPSYYLLQTIRGSVRPLFRTRLRLGEFDPPTMNPYNALGLEDVQTEAHRQLALEAAIQSLVLLKNQRGMLPLKAPDVLRKNFAVSVPPWSGVMGRASRPLLHRVASPLATLEQGRLQQRN